MRDSVNANETVWSSGSRKAAEVFFFAFCLETLFSVVFQVVGLATHSDKLAVLAGLGFALVALLFVRRGDAFLAGLRRRAAGLETMRRMWIRSWFACGLVLRVGWAVVFHVSLKSDGMVYFMNGRSLAVEHSFPGALWPPGFSLFLAPFFMVLGAHEWVTDLCALLLFAATYWVIYRLAERLQTGSASLLAVMLFAIWPTDIMLTGVNSKETLLALLVASAMLLYLKADDSGRTNRVGLLVATGVLFGCCALTQPAFLLFPGVIFLCELIRRHGLVQAVWRTALVSVLLLVTVLPWTYRNYGIYHRTVMISMNGGSVFYRANNASANAGYLAEGPEPLPTADFEADKEGYRMGKAWIREHPGKFLFLCLRKQVAFLSEDSVGPYESMKRDLHPSMLLYGLAKEGCNLFWFACWIMLLLGTPTLFRLRFWPLWFGACFLPLVYQWGIDSVFESGSRHHTSYIPLICVLVALAVCARGAEERIYS